MHVCNLKKNPHINTQLQLLILINAIFPIRNVPVDNNIQNSGKKRNHSHFIKQTVYDFAIRRPSWSALNVVHQLTGRNMKVWMEKWKRLIKEKLSK